MTTSLNIDGIMQKKKTDALREIKSQLWGNEPDADKIASLALMTGISGEQITQMESEINQAKDTINAIHQFDMDQLRKAKSDAAKNAAKSLVRLQKAENEHQAASEMLTAAEHDLNTALDAYGKVVNVCMTGKIPADRIPEEVGPFAEISQRTLACQQLEAAIAKINYAIHEQKKLIESQEFHVENLNREHAMTGNRPSAIGGGQMKDAMKLAAAKLETLKSEMSEAESRHEDLQKQLADARKELDQAKAKAGM